MPATDQPTRRPFTIRIPCHGRQHRIHLRPNGRLSFPCHTKIALRLESLLDADDGCATVADAERRERLDELPAPILREFEAVHNDLCDAVRAEWKRCHHNARLPSLPYEDGDDEIFWDLLGRAARKACGELSWHIANTYGVSLTFYSYGRSGATIAPHEWMGPIGGNHFGGLRSGILEWRDDLSSLLEARQTLEILEHINAFWQAKAATVNSWWNRGRVRHKPRL